MNIQHILSVSGKALVVSVSACLMARLVVGFVGLSVYLELMIAAVIGIAIYLPGLYALNVSELHSLIDILQKKILKKYKA